MRKRKCDRCKKLKEKGDFRYRHTTRTYPPKKNSLQQTIIYWTKRVWLCEDCIEEVKQDGEVSK
jgi:hypothetical protein